MRRSDGAPAATAAFALLAIVLTWPLAHGLARDLPADFGDPLLNTWILAWDADHILRALAGHVGALRDYWDANIYHPHPLTLAYSEHLTAQAIMVLPIYALTRNAVLCYNIVFLSTFVISALGMFLFVRRVTGSPGAGFVAGLAFGFAPYRFGTLPHVQVLSSMWMPFVLLGIDRFLETRRPAPLAWGSVAWIAQNLSCGYYMLFFSPVVALYAALEITRRTLWRDRGVWLKVCGAAAVVLLVTVPFLLPYVRLRDLGFNARSLGETIRFSADVFGYLTTDVSMALWGRVVRAWPRPEGSLFPGFGVALLALFAIVSQTRHAIAGARPERPAWSVRILRGLWLAAAGITLAILGGWSLRLEAGAIGLRLTSLDRGLYLVVGFGVALAIVSPRAREIARRWVATPAATLTLITLFAFAMSLGPQVTARGRVVAEANVYSPFYAFVPGYDGVRVPARFAMIVALGLAALAGCGAAPIARRRHGAAALAVLGTIIIAESWAAPIAVNVNSTDYKQSGLLPLPGTLPTAADLPAVYRFVALLPPSSALIELPFGEIAFETRYMYASTFHWRALVNGYSGGAPDDYGLWAERLKEIHLQPDAAWQAVVESRATHLIVHEGSYAADRGRQISAWAAAHGAREVGAFDSDRIFAVR